MKRIFKYSLLPVLASMCLASCLQVNFEEANEVLVASVDKVEVVADNIDGSAVSDTLLFTCNRSWSATVVPACDWVTLGVEEHMNLSGVSEKVQIPVHFSDNEGGERTASIVITTKDGKTTVPVTQKVLVPRLMVTSEQMVAGISSDADTSIIKINSNIAWTAKVEDGATASVTLEKAAGSKSGELKVYFAESEDTENTQQAVVVLSAEGCEDVKVTMVQNIAVPYFKLDEGNVYTIPGWVYSSSSANQKTLTHKLAFKTNQAWTAEIEGADNYPDFALSAMSGAKGKYTLTISSNINNDPVVDRKVTVKFKTADCSEEAKLTQEGLLVFSYSSGSTGKNVLNDTDWPFTSPAKSMITNSASNVTKDPYKSLVGVVTDFVFKPVNEHVYTLKVSNGGGGVWGNSKSGLNNKGTATAFSYVEFPVIEGKKLVRVDFMSGVTSVTYEIQSAKTGEAAAGGTAWECPAAYKTNTWNLTGTDAAVAYRLQATSGTNFSIDYLLLRYE